MLESGTLSSGIILILIDSGIILIDRFIFEPHLYLNHVL